jgi:hypothetical protein
MVVRAVYFLPNLRVNYRQKRVRGGHHCHFCSLIVLICVLP